MNYMDLIAAAIVIIFGIIGWKKGIVKSVVRLLSLGASIILAWLLHPIISDLLRTIGLRQLLFEKVHTTIEGYIGGAGNTAALPKFIESAVASGQAEAVSAASGTAADMVLGVISFIAVLILARVLIWVGQKILLSLSELPVIGAVNHAMGLVLGLCEGVLAVLLLCTLIYGVMPVRENAALSDAIENSAIVKQMYENNPIMKVIGDKNDSNAVNESDVLKEAENGE